MVKGLLLKRKLGRTIRSTLGLFIALAIVVLIGVTLFVGGNNAYSNVSRSQAAFSEDIGFADYYIHLVSAPEGVSRQIAALDGVKQVNGRIQRDVDILRDDQSKITGRLTSYQLPLEKNINRLFPVRGRLWQTEDAHGYAGLIDEPLALSNHLEPGMTLKIVAGGAMTSFSLIGTAVSPEFQAYGRNATSWFEDNGFGLLMMPYKQAQAICGMEGRINQVLLSFVPGADEARVIKEVESLLRRYGIVASYSKRDHGSYKSLEANLNTLRNASRFVPIVFFAIVNGFLFIFLRQIIRSQRLQIGVMKALGFASPAIMAVYMAYSVLVTLAGAVMGLVAGTYLARSITDVFADSLNLPLVTYSLNPEVVLAALALCLMTGILSGGLATLQIIRINPAEAIRPEPPKMGNASFWERYPSVWEHLSSSWRMTLRSIGRNRFRFAITALGIMSSVLMMVFTLFYLDSKEYLLRNYFHEINTYNYKLHFSSFVKGHDTAYWRNWPEIQRFEPIIEILVTYSRVDSLAADGKSEDGILVGVEPGSHLKKAFDQERQEVLIPEKGIILYHKTAENLGLTVGDYVQIETKLGIGPDFKAQLPIKGITTQYVNPSSFASREQMSRILEGSDLANAVLVRMDTALKPLLLEHLADIPKFDFMLEKEGQEIKAVAYMNALTIFDIIGIVAAVSLGFVLVYNTSAMCFNDRQKELATLRVVGFSRQRISRLQFNEQLLAYILGVGLGLPLGRVLGGYYVESLSTASTIYPVVINPGTYLLTALVTLAFMVVAHGLAMLRLKGFDLVETLKNRD